MQSYKQQSRHVHHGLWLLWVRGSLWMAFFILCFFSISDQLVSFCQGSSRLLECNSELCLYNFHSWPCVWTCVFLLSLVYFKHICYAVATLLSLGLVWHWGRARHGYLMVSRWRDSGIMWVKIHTYNLKATFNCQQRLDPDKKTLRTHLLREPTRCWIGSSSACVFH